MKEIRAPHQPPIEIPPRFKIGTPRLLAAAILALGLSGCIYEPAPIYGPAYPAYGYYPAPVYEPAYPPIYGSLGIGIGGGWGWGGGHHHHWR